MRKHQVMTHSVSLLVCKLLVHKDSITVSLHYFEFHGFEVCPIVRRLDSWSYFSFLCSDSKSSNRSRSQSGDGPNWRRNLLMQYGNVLSQRSHHRYLWMRMALMEKKLAGIIEALVQRAEYVDGYQYGDFLDFKTKFRSSYLAKCQSFIWKTFSKKKITF